MPKERVADKERDFVMNRITRFAISAVTSILCWLFFSFTSDLYMYTDNVGVAIVLDGYFANPLSQYQHPLFCLLVNLLSRILPFADMYTVTVHILIFLGLFILTYLLLGRIKNTGKWSLDEYLLLMITILFCIFVSAGLNIWRANYTIQAGSVLFTGWLILAVVDKRRLVVIGTTIISFGYMMRKEAGLIFVPFIILVVLTEFVSGKKIRSIASRYLPACIVLILLMSSQAMVDHIEPFAEAKQYNDARTALVDFPVKNWNETEFVNINKVDYNAATNWLFSDTEIINADLLSEMASAASKNQYDYSLGGLRSAFHEMLRVAGKTDVYMSVMVILCILAALWNAVFQRSCWLKEIAVSAVLGAFLILLYFTFRGRAPLRVWQPVLFASMYVELVVVLKGRIWIGRSVPLLLLCIILYYSAGQVIAHADFHSFRTTLTARIGVDDSAYEATFTDDALYIWPNWHATIPEHFGDMGKLATRRVMEHNIALGDWTSGQPYYTEFLKRIGHENPIRDLVEGKNTYIMSDSDYILDFLRFHYGDDIELVKSGEVNGTTAYRVERAS